MYPGINKIEISCKMLNGEIISNVSEQNRNGCHIVIPSSRIELHNGSGILTVLNLSKLETSYDKGQCVSRGIPSGQSPTEVPVAPEVLPKDVQQRLDNLLNQYQICFAKNNAELGNTNIEMEIKLTSSQPVCYRPYQLSYYERHMVREIINDLLKNDIIEPSVSPYASPILLVKKKTGDVRMCIDYRKLNAITVKDKYPLPRIENQLERLAGNNCFTTLDLKSGYHQLKVAENSRPYTAFITPDGHYQYKRIPFGLTNAPAVFQRAINDILGSLRFSYALAYLDDILIISNGRKEGLERLENVLKIFRNANLTLNREKCSFLKSTVDYLGSVISNGELRPSQHKIEAITNFPTLRNVHDVRRFLGLASYFRKFIHNFALKAKPLTILTKASTPWQWKEDQEAAFNLLKQELSSEPVLALYDPKLETQLHTDASQIGLAGLLMQKQSDGKWKPVMYTSQQTSDSESRFHSYELETLSVVISVRKFRNYLYGIKFTVVTDCNALRLTWTKRDLSPRIGRWWLALQEYDFDVIYRPGTQMKHVDALSRQPLPFTVNMIKEADWVDCIQSQDDGCMLIKKQLEEGTAEKCYTLVDNKICRVINKENRILIPKDVRWRVVKLQHDDNGHPGLKRTLESIQRKYWFPQMKEFVTKYVKSCIPCLSVKKPTGKRKGYLHPIPKMNKPFHTLHLDHLGPFCRTGNGNVYMLVIVDAFTKYVWIEAVPDTSTKHVVQCLKLLIKIFGVPDRVISDRGKCFTSMEMKKFCNEQNIKHILNAIACPRSNGQVERFNATILNAMMTAIGDEHDSWEAKITEVQHSINGTVNATTGRAPAELLYGFRPRLKFDVSIGDNEQVQREDNLKLMRAKAVDNINKSASAMKRRYDKNRGPAVTYKVGEMVMIERTPIVKGLTSGKLVGRYIGPVRVQQVLPNDRYRVESLSKDRRRFRGVVSSDKMKLFKTQTID